MVWLPISSPSVVRPVRTDDLQVAGQERRRRTDLAVLRLVRLALAWDGPPDAVAVRVTALAGADHRLLALARARVARALLTTPSTAGARAAAVLSSALSLDLETDSPGRIA